MKKCLAILSAVALTLALASCGDSTTDATSSAAPASSSAPVSVAPATPTPVPTPTPEPTPDPNVAHADDATYVDMNTGLSEGDEGFLAYYDNSPSNGVDAAFDANTATGWQLASNEVKGEESQAESDAENYYLGTDGNCYQRVKYDDKSVWLGVVYAEAKTVDTVVVKWEGGSAPKAFEDGGFYFQFTEDGEKWEKLDVTLTREEVPAGDSNDYTDTATFDAKDVKGIRVVIVKGNTKYAPKVWEFEVYAPEAADAE